VHPRVFQREPCLVGLAVGKFILNPGCLRQGHTKREPINILKARILSPELCRELAPSHGDK
jgi:hypothetical protein